MAWRDSISKPGVLALVAVACSACGWWAPILSDEVFSLDTAQLPISQLLSALASDVHPPLYYALLKAWLVVFPASVEALRALSGLLLAVGVWSFYRSVQREWGDGAAYSAAAFLLANPLVLLLGSYGRMYTLLLLCCVLALDAGLRKSPTLLAAYVFAGLLTHNWFLFALPPLVFLYWWKRRWLPVLPLAAGGVAYAILWGPVALEQLRSRSDHLAWLKTPGLASLGDVLIAHFWLTLPLAAFLALKKKSSRLYWPALAAGVGCLLIPLALSQWKPVFNPRFTVVAAPFFALALMPLATQNARAFLGVASLLVAGWLGWNQPDCNSRSAASVLQREARPGDTVIFCRLTRKPVEWYWPASVAERLSFPRSTDSHPGYEAAPGAAQLEQEAESLRDSLRGRRVWLLMDTNAAASQILRRALGGTGQVLLQNDSAGKQYFNRLEQLQLAGDPSQRVDGLIQLSTSVGGGHDGPDASLAARDSGKADSGRP